MSLTTPAKAARCRIPISSPPYLKTQQISFPVNSFANPFYTPDPFGQAFPEPMTLLVVARNLHLPYAQDWNLNIQQSLGADWLFQIGYVGTTGVRLPRFIEGNPAVFVPGVDTTSPVVRWRRLVRFPPKTM